MDNRLYYFDWAANGLMTPEVHQAVVHSHKALAEHGSIAAAKHRTALAAELREAAGRFLRVPSDSIVFVPNTSTLIISLAATLSPHIRTIGAIESEYPSLLLPFERQGYEMKYFPLSADGCFNLDAYIDFLIDEKVSLAILSHVQWNTGVRSDIRRFCAACREAGIHTLIDATQSMGIIDLALDQVDADIVVASSYKWLQAGFGLAIAHLSEAFRRRFPARIGGFGSYTTDGSLLPEHSTAFYEPGHLSSPTMSALLCSLRQKMEVGMAKLEAEATSKTERIVEVISSKGLEMRGFSSAQKRGMIVSYAAPKSAHDALLAAGFQCTYRSGAIRLSVHYSTTDEELDALAKHYRRV